MGKIQNVIIKDLESIGQIAISHLARFSRNLITSSRDEADNLSVEEIGRRVKKALRALNGEDVSTSGAATTRDKTSLEIARKMVNSYTFDKETGFSTFTVPARVTDVEAMKALNEYFRQQLPRLNRFPVYAGDFDWFENLPNRFPRYCEQRDYRQARQITITGVVKGTEGKARRTQGSVLSGHSLFFSDPRDLAIAAALHACKHEGEDLFKCLWVRCSVPGFALVTNHNRNVRARAVCVRRYTSAADRDVAASGSPSPKSKN